MNNKLNSQKTSTVILCFFCFALLFTFGLQAETLESQWWPVLTKEQLQALKNTVSGELALDHIRVISRLWRWAPSKGFHEAAEFVTSRAREYGLQDAAIERFIADGQTEYFGVKLYRPSWDPLSAELWVTAPVREKITSFTDVPMSLAGYSRPSDVTAELVDVGEGTSAQDYAGKDVKGKIVLGTGPVGTMQRMAVFERGAAGVLTAWVPEYMSSRSPLDNPDAVTWGTGVVPKSPSGEVSTFGFMLSRRQRHRLLELQKKHGPLTVHAKVDSRIEEPGYLEVATATIPGTQFPEQEVVFTAHLEHPKPSANDNASGSATLLEMARILQNLIDTGQLPPPKRTIRFLWVQEARSTRAFLSRHPEVYENAVAAINMDMVGSHQQKTKAIFYIFRSPAFRPTFFSDIVENFFELVQNISNEKKLGEPLDPIWTSTGSRLPLVGYVRRYLPGSDDRNFLALGIPALNFLTWPDEFHHTQFDTPDKVDPTQLARVAFIGAASASALTMGGPDDVAPMLPDIVGRAATRIGEDLARALRYSGDAGKGNAAVVWKEAQNIIRQGYVRELAQIDSLRLFAEDDQEAATLIENQKVSFASSQEAILQILDSQFTSRRENAPETSFGEALSRSEQEANSRIPVWTGRISADDDTLARKLAPETIKSLEIFRYGNQEKGEPLEVVPLTIAPFYTNFPLFAALNFVDGKKSILEIRNAVSAAVTPIPLSEIDQLFVALEEADLVEIQRREQ